MSEHSEVVQKLLDRPRIRTFLESNVGAKKEVMRAVEQLAGRHDAEAAIVKLLPALNEKKIFVFFSYKKKDERTAHAIVRTLRKWSAGKLQISYQADFTEQIAGKAWRAKIREEIARANWFILLLPDPSDDWDWCLYETGLFDRELTSSDRLICLHHPDTKIPDQIVDYHAVSATLPEVESFLRMVYLGEDPIPGLEPINRDIEADISDIAKEIVDAIRPAQESTVHQSLVPKVTLKIPEGEKKDDPDDLAGALIVSANKDALDLFGFMDPPATWGELTSEIGARGGDGRWRKELFQAISKIRDGRKFPLVHAVFRTEDDRTFRPVPSAIDRLGGAGPIHTFDVMFVEVYGVVDHSSMPRDLSTLATLMRLAFRFRWEVLKKFGEHELTDEDMPRLEHALADIEADSRSRGVIDQDSVIALFPEHRRAGIDEMLQHWSKLRDVESGSGELDRAIDAKDKGAVARLLTPLFPMNEEFLQITATRFAELATGEHHNPSE